MANSVDLDEVAHNEPPYQDLRCLQIQQFSSLVVKELILLNIRQKQVFYFKRDTFLGGLN